MPSAQSRAAASAALLDLKDPCTLMCACGVLGNQAGDSPSGRCCPRDASGSTGQSSLPRSQPACLPDCCPDLAAGVHGTSGCSAIPAQSQIDMLLPSNPPGCTRVESIHRWGDTRHRGAPVLIPTQSDVRAPETLTGWAQPASAWNSMSFSWTASCCCRESLARGGASCMCCWGNQTPLWCLPGACFAAAGGEAR